MWLSQILGAGRDLLVFSILVDNHGVWHRADKVLQFGVEFPDLPGIQNVPKKAVALRMIICSAAIGFHHSCPVSVPCSSRVANSLLPLTENRSICGRVIMDSSPSLRQRQPQEPWQPPELSNRSNTAIGAAFHPDLAIPLVISFCLSLPSRLYSEAGQERHQIYQLIPAQRGSQSRWHQRHRTGVYLCHVSGRDGNHFA